MEFNIKKCNVLSVTLKTKNALKFHYTMKGLELDAVQNTKYLGVTFTNKLTWDIHIGNISGAANRMLSLLWRNLKSCPKALKEKAYKAYVRPKLEYASPVCDPQHQKNILKLEMVQRRAARFVTKMPLRQSDGQYASVSERIQDLGWKSLQERRKNNRLVMLYRVVHNLVEIPHHTTPFPESFNQPEVTSTSLPHCSQR